MSCQNCWKKLLPFGLTLVFGFFAVSFIQRNETKNNQQEKTSSYKSYEANYTSYEKFIGKSGGSGCEGCSGSESNDHPNKGKTRPIKVVDKPQAIYTDAARQNNVEGTVKLRVTFLANGAVGSISIVQGLPDGLTEQAVAAARYIRFEPAKRDEIPYTVTKQVHYNFTLY